MVKSNRLCESNRLSSRCPLGYAPLCLPRCVERRNMAGCVGSGAAARWSADGLVIAKANMALCQITVGTGLLLIGARTASVRKLGAAFGAFALAVGAITLTEHVFRIDLGIDQLLASEPPGAPATTSPNRMGIPGSLSLIVLWGGAGRWNSETSNFATFWSCGLLHQFDSSDRFSVPNRGVQPHQSFDGRCLAYRAGEHGSWGRVHSLRSRVGTVRGF